MGLFDLTGSRRLSVSLPVREGGPAPPGCPHRGHLTLSDGSKAKQAAHSLGSTGVGSANLFEAGGGPHSPVGPHVAVQGRQALELLQADGARQLVLGVPLLPKGSFQLAAAPGEANGQDIYMRHGNSDFSQDLTPANEPI